MKKSLQKVTFAGGLILILAFSYSWFSIVAGRSEAVVLRENGETGSRVPQMDMGMSAMNYQDGLYQTTVNYEIPYGYVEPMFVELKLSNGTITDVTATFEVVNPVSADYQRLFTDYVSREVIGKDINKVALSRRAGASLTNRAFDRALENIKAQAARKPIMPEDDMVPMQLPGMSSRNNGEVQVFQLPHAPSVDTSEFTINSVDIEASLNSTLYTVDHSYTINSWLTEPMLTTVTVADGVIVDAAVAFDSPDQISTAHQQVFIDEYYGQIIGQPIETAAVSRISYASITTKAFNDALEAIRSEYPVADNDI